MQDDNEKTEVNNKNLANLLKAMKQNKVVSKIGILGSHNARSGKGSNSNATIGAAHEFSAPARNLPMRSFLRMPITTKFPKALENAHAFTEDAAKEVLKEGSFRVWIEKASILAVATVLEAFDSNGFGTWADLKPATWEHKKVKQVLVETQSLRNSISYEITKS